MLKPFSVLDIVALAGFIGAWLGYAIVIEWTPFGRQSLNGRMNRYREEWVQRILGREMRMVDMQIMAGLQNGTAFFASTSLLAIGGALTLLRSTEELILVVSGLPFGIQATRELWEAKTVGLVLVLIFAYAFFKFGWSYRLFNYVAILVGSMPYAAEKDSPEAAAHVTRTARLFEAAGLHFNRGQRAFFFAIGYLGWFVGPVVLMIATVAVLWTMWRRQFACDAMRAVMAE